MLRAVVCRRGPAPSVLFRASTQPQWPHASGCVGARAQRWYADDKTVLPGSQSRSAPPLNIPAITSPPTANPATPSSTTPIPPANVPKAPLPPQQVQTAPPTSIPPGSSANAGSTPPSPPPKPPKRRRFRRFLILTLTTLGLAYGGGLYYALISDDFHDWFIEYAPWGEDAVLFFEEREFKRRFPEGRSSSGRMYPQVTGENKVTISGKSGASARVSERSSAEIGTGGKHSSAVESKSEKSASKASAPAPAPATGAKAEKTNTEAKVDKAKDAPAKTATKSDKKADEKPAAQQSTEKKAPQPSAEAKPAPSSPPKDAAPAKPQPAPAAAPIALIDTINVENASDPVVQKVSKMLNDVIAVINADNASGKYSSAVSKAKEDLKSLSAELETYRASQAKEADERIKKTETEFDQAAKNLVSRVEQEQKNQEMRWREEYEAERERLSESYDNKLKAELDAAQKVADQKLRNELLQQNITLQKGFTETVRDRVENERDARLSKLNELSSAVSELENLTGQWNEVVDANLRTQHLVVAVDAVRAALENNDQPRPFVQELAALKEVAHNDRVIDAAIASIHPSAYQRGLPTSAQLIDRFRRVAAEVRKAALLPEDAGVASHAASLFLSKVMFKKQGLAMGDDVESILTRTEMLLEEGDLDEAAREMNGLTGWAKVLSQDWLKDCRTVLEAKQALDVIATEARLQSLAVE